MDASRQAILEAVVHAAGSFLRSSDWEVSTPPVLGRLGEAADVSRVYIFRNHAGPDGELLTSQRYEWTAPRVPPLRTESILRNVSLRRSGCGRWEEVLASGGVIEGPVDGLPESERDFVAGRGARSLAVLPIHVEDRWWGFMGFDDCFKEREWPASSLAALKTAADLLSALRTRRRLEGRYRRLADAAMEGLLIHDGARIIDANASGAALIGHRLEEVIGRNPFDMIAPEFRELALFHASTGSEEPYEIEIMRADGARIPVEVKGAKLPYRDSVVRVVALRDVTARKQAEESERRWLEEQAARREAEAAERRADFLAEASRVLASSFDYSTALTQVARLTVAHLADYCIVDMCQAGRIRRVTTAAADQSRAWLIQRLEAFVPDPDDAENPIVRVIESCEPLLVPIVDEASLGAVIRTAEHRDILAALAPRTALFVPIVARSGTLGVLTLISTQTDRSYSTDDLALARDLASRAGLAIQNAQLFEEAQEATRARDEILAVVAHDVRNPLGVVLNGAELLMELDAGEGQRIAGLIERSARHIDRLVNDLLEITRLERGRLELERTELAPSALVADALAMMRPLAEARAIRLEADETDHLPTVLADGARVLQVFSNLVGNAIKFSPEQTRVRLACALDGPGVRFEVTDEGPGIPADQIPHVFSRFWQAKSADRRGAGLGLSIAKGIIEAHGGQIWLESQFGAGTSFYFTLPQFPGRPPGPEAAA
jgi:PAS domain S-box-containing protein